MQNKTYDVSLLWHDGGCLFLCTVRAKDEDDAGEIALHKYTAYSKKQADEIENGGDFQLIAQVIS